MLTAREESRRLASKLRGALLAVLLGAHAPGDFRLKPSSLSIPNIFTVLKNYAKSTLRVRCRRNNKAWMTARVFTTWLTEYCKPTFETYCSETDSIKTLLLIHSAPGRSPKSSLSDGDVQCNECLLTQHPCGSPWIKEQFQHSSLII